MSSSSCSLSDGSSPFNDYIQLPALNDLKCNELLIIENESRNNNDMQIVYDCNLEIENISHDKSQFIKTLKEPSRININRNEVMSDIENENENIIKLESELESNADKNESDSEYELSLNNFDESETEYETESNESESEIRHNIQRNDKSSSFLEEKYEEMAFNDFPESKWFPCTYADCNKVYSFRNTRKFHIQEFHLQVRNYTCKYCKLKFYRKSDWKRHVRIHTGEKPFECCICLQTFSQKSSLKRHSKRKH